MHRFLKPQLITVLLLASPQAFVTAQSGSPTINVYGFVMLDAGYNFDQIHPNWTDVVRPSKLPSFENQYAPDGNMFFGVRQTRLGVKGNIPTPIGELKTTFEFELFGTGVDEGQTTFRLRHAYGELGHFGAGQTWSPFMDIDVFPNSLEYWGPTGMVFFRNLQVRWMPIQGDSRMTIALERPGASADQGVYSGRIELQDVKPRFQYPDLSAEYRLGRKWGYIELAGLVRRIAWEDQGTDNFALSGDATGWGLNLSSNLNLGKNDVARFQAMYGEGVENYMNDAPADVGIENQPGNPIAPIKGVALPVTGVVAFLDHTWSTKFTTAVGYSMVDIDNTAQQAPDAFSKAQYALGNVLYSPTPGVTAGVEFQWGNRDNFTDGFTSDIRKIQFSFKYAFSKTY
jgi:outer membrane DcaP-like protein